MSDAAEKLGLHGGTPVKTTDFGRGPKHDLKEWEAIKPVFERGNINMTRGPEVMKLRELFCERFRKEYAVTASSGTAALHTATGAFEVGRGDEVITSPFTDMGTITAIVQQNAVPVIADVDPMTLMITPETVGACMTKRTRAVIPVHLAGLACDIPGIRKITEGKGIGIIEDVAQSYLCTYNGETAGTMGDIGCWSLNESKHIGAGDGGILLTDDEKLADRADLFADKCYDRTGGGRNPFFAPYNYRLSTLTAAVCLEQLKKLDWICETRQKLGSKLDQLLAEIPGITPRPVGPGDTATYWYYLFSFDPGVVKTDIDQLCKAIGAEGVYAGKMDGSFVLNWDYFRNPPQDKHACSCQCPLYQGSVDYRHENYPGAIRATRQAVRMSISEFFTEQDIEDMAGAVRKVASYYT